jgi:hypothetical protein
MLLSLGKYGLTLNDIRVEAGLPNLSGANATYSLSTLNAFVRVWLNRLEVFFGDPARVQEEQFPEFSARRSRLALTRVPAHNLVKVHRDQALGSLR